MLMNKVVCLCFPTSNHNQRISRWVSNQLYVFAFLHQTTTARSDEPVLYKLYVFAFLHQTTTLDRFTLPNPGLYVFAFLHQTTTEGDLYDNFIGCMSLLSYIKPQLFYFCYLYFAVVCLCFPTSNHNLLKLI